MTAVEFTFGSVDSELERRDRDETLADEADRLSRSFPSFIRGAWEWVIPFRRIDSWSIDCMAEHVQAVYDREITRLITTVPPGSLKSSLFSVFGPAWQWTRRPSERIVSASWGEHLSNRDTRRSRMLMQTPWYQARWGHLFNLAQDENLKGRYSNDENGHRIATYVGGGTGDRGDTLIVDDPHNAKEAHTQTQLASAIEWYGDTWISRLNNPADWPGVMMIVGQRIDENDLIEYLLSLGVFHHLCLPARHEREHPYAPYRGGKTNTGRKLPGDPRKTEGEILNPDYTTEEALREVEVTMTPHVAAGQLQQRPSAREGDMLKRSDWRYYPPRKNEETDEQLAHRLPSFTRIVSSWDTPLKEKEANDLIAGQLYGEHGADRYQLDIVEGHMNYAVARRSVIEQHAFARRLWPDALIVVLIEKGGYGKDLALDLKREITGVIEIPEKGDRLPDKVMRADSASASLLSGNVFLPGYPSPTLTGPDKARSPASTMGFVETCASFPNGRYKDPVDAWSQAMNYMDKHPPHAATISSARGVVIDNPVSIPR